MWRLKITKQFCFSATFDFFAILCHHLPHCASCKNEQTNKKKFWNNNWQKLSQYFIFIPLKEVYIPFFFTHLLTMYLDIFIFTGYEPFQDCILVLLFKCLKKIEKNQKNKRKTQDFTINSFLMQLGDIIYSWIIHTFSSSGEERHWPF